VRVSRPPDPHAPLHDADGVGRSITLWRLSRPHPLSLPAGHPMRRRSVVFFAGARTIKVPYSLWVSALIVLVAACAVALLNAMLPGLLGTAPILPVPGIVQSVANVLGFFTGIAVMLAVIAFAWGHWESRRADARFTDFERLVPLEEVLASGLVIAPNVVELDRGRIIVALRRIAAHQGISSIMAPATAGEMQEGSVDRLLVVTTEGASEFRRLVRGLRCDDIARVPARSARRIVTQAEVGSGSMWMLTWD